MRDDDDFWSIRDLLIETYPITPTGWNWEIRRWDGWRFHHPDPAWQERWEQQVCLWEDGSGRALGVVHPGGSGGDAHLQLHPGHRHLEAEMLEWAEGHLAAPGTDGVNGVEVFAFDYDSPRVRLLQELGYEQTPLGGVTRRLRFGHRPIPGPEIAPGYVMRTTRPDDADFRAVAALFNAAFRRATHTAEESRAFREHSPSFDFDLELVAEASDGALAALVGVTYDEENRRGIFEPVCTHPDHLRHGLALALMHEGQIRLEALGAADAYVDTGDDEAPNRLYERAGFTEAYRGRVWRKAL